MFPRAIAHYQIVEKIGEGGMGVVYKARDTRLERMAALKVLPADKTLDPERKRRFVQEAKAASALNHPNIVTIYDIGTDDGIDSARECGPPRYCGSRCRLQMHSLQPTRLGLSIAI